MHWSSAAYYSRTGLGSSRCRWFGSRGPGSASCCWAGVLSALLLAAFVRFGVVWPGFDCVGRGAGLRGSGRGLWVATGVWLRNRSQICFIQAFAVL